MHHCYNFAVHPISLVSLSRSIIVASVLRCFLALHSTASALQPADFFAIKVVDDQTGRGVPLVEVRTVSSNSYYTDSNGMVALCEPGLMDQDVFFSIRSHGYEFPRDGFGNAGVTVHVAASRTAELKIQRRNIAERLYRITGEGIYRDSVLLGLATPLQAPLLNGQVVGQDSTSAAIHRGKIYWIWGDTLRLRYPLGNFGSSGAVSEMPDKGGVDPRRGIDLHYFLNPDGFSRPMWTHTAEGLLWTDGMIVVPDTEGSDRMVARYAHMQELATMLDHGIGLWDDTTDTFQKITGLDLAEKWRCPHGHPVRVTSEEGDHIYLSAAYNSLAPFPAVRVRAQFESVKDPARYEAFTPLARGARFEGEKTRLERGSDGRLRYGWKSDTAPITPAQEAALLKWGILKAAEARYQPRDIDSEKVVTVDGGSVNWNAYRRKWIMIAVEKGGASSFLGEIWYSEADSILGPWLWAKKVVSHDRYSFYNPVHHPFFDQEQGRFIYFEGTYTNSFSGTHEKTPRYDYNQIMYRLDLSDRRLQPLGLNDPRLKSGLH